MTNSVFAEDRARWLPLYKQLRSLTLRKIGPFNEYAVLNSVLWKHSSTFAEISPKEACMIVAFASDALHEEWAASKVLQLSQNRVVHYFEVCDSSLFAELVERISEAYVLPGRSR